MRIFTFLAGAAVGYLVGARAGRERYDQIRDKAQDLWNDPRTQETLNDVGSTIKEKAPEVGSAAASAAGTVAGKVKETAANASHRAPSSDSADDSGTPPHAGDHISDPSLGSAGGTSDWSDEGGATPSGPSAVN
ncbi:MAG: YtxH domain-containing protein [Micrococcaceae bacterium]|uniref:YtxH domain-containing protein n=1 Tax=Arthrobacter sp. 179 TaxID=3457734 RepID=UPI0026547AD8|nr:YtxH domain-containing protein [Micrococcaceae bacterium]MDN5887800.1 YtxH domain-containing protein [Micrococcaceae bacterium]